MKNNLGKIILCFLFPYILNAQVLLQSPDTFYENDTVIFTLIAQGDQIKMPEIKKVDNFIVQNGGTSQHTTIVNGTRTFQIVQKYMIVANKDISIPAFEIIVDNQVLKTKPKIIKMLKVEKTKSDLYDLTISTNKSEVYVGESIIFTLKFKYKKDLEITGLDFTEPSFENFWIKKLPTQNTQKNTSDYNEQELQYLLFPQKEGDVTLGALKIGVNTLKKGFGRSFYLSTPTDTTSVYSNKLNIKVNPLPKNITLIGDFTIKSSIDKTKIDQGEAVSYKLFIEGRGNIDDLDEVTLNIPEATIYDNPAKKEYNLQNNSYGGAYEKTYSIVAQKDFNIPSVELHYFDKKTQSIKTIKTKSYDIEVTSNPKVAVKLEVQEPLKIEENKSIQSVKLNIEEKIFYFLIGLVVGSILISLLFLYKNRARTKEEKPLIKVIKSLKTPKELFKVLLVYINIDEELDKIIFNLENISDEEYKKERKNIIKSIDEIIAKDKKSNILL